MRKNTAIKVPISKMLFDTEAVNRKPSDFEITKTITVEKLHTEYY